MKPLVIIFVGFLLSCICFTSPSCRKKTDCVASIHCVDSAGGNWSGANVQLYAIVKTSNGGTVVADIKANGNTDGDGKVKFTFKLPAIYDIRATKVLTSPTKTIDVSELKTGNYLMNIVSDKGTSTTKFVKE